MLAQEMARKLNINADIGTLTDVLADAATAAEIGLRLANEPLDLLLSGGEFLENPGLLTGLALLPSVPGGAKKLAAKNALADTSNLAKPLGRGSTGRTAAANLNEQLAMKQAMSDPVGGFEIENVKLADPRWPASDGWIKMRQNINGTEIHYVQNTITGAVDDFKFK